MRRLEVVAMLGFSVILLTVGLTWLFGPYGLVGCGAVLLVASMLIDAEG